MSETITGSAGEIVESTELAALFRQSTLEPRCRVCRNDALRRKINDLLAVGASYAMILRAIEDDNGTLDNRDRVTIDSISNHCARHFPVQNVAKATYREILERRAKENGIDFANAVATAITPMAFFETVMAKGYETLVDPDTKVDVSTGMIAAGRLQALIESRASDTSMAQIIAQVDRIIRVIHSTVPGELWPEIVRKLDGAVDAVEPLGEDEPDIFHPANGAFDDDLDELDELDD